MISRTPARVVPVAAPTKAAATARCKGVRDTHTSGPRSLAFAPSARRTGGELVLWLPRYPRAAEGSNGRSWRVKSRATKAWHELVAAAIATLGKAPPAWEAVTVKYELHRAGGAPFDPDNIPTLLKPVLDAVVGAGVLPDDGPEHLLGVPAAAQELSPLPFPFVVVRVRRALARFEAQT